MQQNNKRYKYNKQLMAKESYENLKYSKKNTVKLGYCSCSHTLVDILMVPPEN